MRSPIPLQSIRRKRALAKWLAALYGPPRALWRMVASRKPAAAGRARSGQSDPQEVRRKAKDAW